MTAKRIARALAVLSVAAAVGGSLVIVSRMSTLGANPDTTRILLLMLLPSSMTAVGAIASHRDWIWVVWAATGALWGFAVAAAWSLGLFYVPAALLLFASGVASLGAQRSWWNAACGPLWMLEGVSAVAVMFLLLQVSGEVFAGRYVVFPGQTREFSGSPASVSFVPEAMMFGAWMFVGASSLLAASYLGRFGWNRRQRLQTSVRVGLAAVLVSVVLIGSLAARRAVGELGRSGAGGCESSGAKTTCWSR